MSVQDHELDPPLGPWCHACGIGHDDVRECVEHEEDEEEEIG